MFAQAHAPDYLDPRDLDAYLERGWFRMGQTIFTTNFIRFKNRFYSTIWLRLLLSDLKQDNTEARLFKKNAPFNVEIKQAVVTPEKEELYTRYRQTLQFQPSESLAQLLFGKSDRNIYSTLEVVLYDQDKLIAFGFFDLGATSAAGIISVYDPEYKKYSLGKYIIYQKIKYCRDKGLQYFYPGYFVPGYPYFDYKLTIGRSALEFFRVRDSRWIPIDHFIPEDVPYNFMYEKLEGVLGLLLPVKPECRLLRYEYFDANLIPELRDAELFDFPLVITIPNALSGSMILLVYDVRDAKFHLHHCVPVWTTDRPNEDPAFFSTYLLKSIQEIHSTRDPAEAAEIFLRSRLA